MKQKQEQANISQNAMLNHCNLCGKKSQFLCGRCHDIGYCKPQHQKADWPAHRPKCISIAEKTKKHIMQRNILRGQILKYLSDSQFVQACQIASNLVDKQKRFNQLNPTLQNEIEYGSTVMLMTRTWIYLKDFNKALDVLNGYLQVKMPFLASNQNLSIPEQGGLTDPEQMKLIEKKLNLISAVISLSHQLVRNAINIYEILINHIQVIYGPNSQQLANAYFYAGNYLNFLNQPNKALACFLKCAKLRGKNCSVSYYNAGIIFLNQKNYNQALDILLMSLNNLTEYERGKNEDLQVSIYEALSVVYRNLNNYNKTVLSIERALCMREKTKQLSTNYLKKYNNLLNLLIVIKSQALKIQSDGKIFSLPKQKNPGRKLIQINKQHYNNILHADNPTLNEDQENQDWIESFNQFRKRLNVVSKIPQVPLVAYEKLLGKDKQEIVRQEEIPKVMKNKDKKPIEQRLKVSLEFIEKLNASEMDFLNELNRLMSECKQKSALIDIFQNSNLFQTLSKDKLDHLYRLNPKLLRDSNTRNIKLMDDFSEGNESFSKEYVNYPQTQKKNKMVTPRLKLQNLPKPF